MGSAASRPLDIMGKPASKLDKQELKTLERSTYFKKDQLQKWYKDFVKDCPDGCMRKEEFGKIYGQFFPTGDPSGFVDYIFNVFDADKDGVITFSEFITAISVTTKGTIDEKLNWAFNLYDYDNDGYVTREEMLDIVTAIYRMHGRTTLGCDDPEKRVDQLFSKLDKDQDGKISREEFCAGFKNDPWIVRALLGGSLDEDGQSQTTQSA